jgi:hypothetical protein
MRPSIATAAATTRTSVIDPRRKQQNDQRAAKLLEFQDQLDERLRAGDARSWQLLEAMHRNSVRKWPRTPLFQNPMDFIASDAAFAAADGLREASIEPLRNAISSSSPVFIVGGQEFRPHEPLRLFGGHTLTSIIAPLTWQFCLQLLIALGELTILINDPSQGTPLGIERAQYASEQSELLRVEHSLWQLAAEYGGPTDRIPHAHRLVLLLMAWDPVAHEAMGGAWTLCVRCGQLLHRKRNSAKALPRCAACMKESPRQRDWPVHAVAPHGRGTWLLRCQHPECEIVFEGPRHRKYCPEHVLSKLAPKHRLPSKPPTSEP